MDAACILEAHNRATPENHARYHAMLLDLLPVGGVAPEVLLVDGALQELDVAATTVQILLVLHLELEHQILPLVVKCLDL